MNRTEQEALLREIERLITEASDRATEAWTGVTAETVEAKAHAATKAHGEAQGLHTAWLLVSDWKVTR